MKEYKLKIGGEAFEVEVGDFKGGKASVCVNGVDYEVEMEDTPQESRPVTPVQLPAKPAEPLSGGIRTVTSPLPGIIVSIDVEAGQKVKRGQKVAVLEAMKMENDILSECDGTVSAVHVKVSDSVLEGTEIITIK